jgi:hypothetical protein
MLHLFQRYACSFLLILVLGVGMSIPASPAHGQANVKPGVRLGVDFMTLGFDGPNPDRRTGLLFGGFALVEVEDAPVALQPELLYVQKGASSERTVQTGINQTSTIETTTKLGYVELPILVKGQIPASDAVKPTVFLGPSFGINVGATQEQEGGGQSSSSDISDNYNTFDIGLTTGVGGDFDVGDTGTVSVDFRYDFSLTDVADGPGEGRNQGFMVTAGFAIAP